MFLPPLSIKENACALNKDLASATVSSPCSNCNSRHSFRSQTMQSHINTHHWLPALLRATTTTRRICCSGRSWDPRNAMTTVARIWYVVARKLWHILRFQKKVTLSLSLRLPCPLRPPRHSADSGTTSDSRTHVGSICIIGCALIASPYTVALIKR